MVEPNETEFKQKISIIRDQFEVCTPYLTTLSDPVRQKNSPYPRRIRHRRHGRSRHNCKNQPFTPGNFAPPKNSKRRRHDNQPQKRHSGLLFYLYLQSARQNYEFGKHSYKSRKKHRHGIHKRKSSMDAEFTFKLKS